jgi:CRP/FNR family transcriptional regulator, cyclic AMP receptor protein
MASGPVPRPSFLQSLAEGQQGELLESGSRKRWERGERVVRRGEPADSAIVLLGGSVKIHTTTAEGDEVVLGFSGPGDLLGEISAVRNTVRTANATAMAEVEGVVIAVSRLRSFLTRHPDATVALLDLVLGRLSVADLRRMEFAASESLARVAARLVELAERFGAPAADGAIEITLPITQEELASWSSSSLESTGRALRTLRGLKLLETSRRRMTVLDLAGLRAHGPRL